MAQSKKMFWQEMCECVERGDYANIQKKFNGNKAEGKIKFTREQQSLCYDGEDTIIHKIWHNRDKFTSGEIKEMLENLQDCGYSIFSGNTQEQSVFDLINDFIENNIGNQDKIFSFLNFNLSKEIEAVEKNLNKIIEMIESEANEELDSYQLANYYTSSLVGGQPTRLRGNRANAAKFNAHLDNEDEFKKNILALQLTQAGPIDEANIDVAKNNKIKNREGWVTKEFLNYRMANYVQILIEDKFFELKLTVSEKNILKEELKSLIKTYLINSKISIYRKVFSADEQITHQESKSQKIKELGRKSAAYDIQTSLTNFIAEMDDDAIILPANWFYKNEPGTSGHAFYVKIIKRSDEEPAYSIKIFNFGEGSENGEEVKTYKLNLNELMVYINKLILGCITLFNIKKNPIEEIKSYFYPEHLFKSVEWKKIMKDRTKVSSFEFEQQTQQNCTVYNYAQLLLETIAVAIKDPEELERINKKLKGRELIIINGSLERAQKDLSLPVDFLNEFFKDKKITEEELVKFAQDKIVEAQNSLQERDAEKAFILSEKTYQFLTENYAENDEMESKIKTLINLGFCYFCFGQHDKAEEKVKLALELAEKSSLNNCKNRARIELANIYVSKNELEQAKTELEIAQKSDGSLLNQSARFNLVYANIHGAKSENTDDPEQKNIFLTTAYSYFQRAHDKAETPYEKALILTNWGNIHSAQKNYEESINLFLKVIALKTLDNHPEHTLALPHNNLAETYHKKFKDSKSIDEKKENLYTAIFLYKKAIELYNQEKIYEHHKNLETIGRNLNEAITELGKIEPNLSQESDEYKLQLRIVELSHDTKIFHIKRGFKDQSNYNFITPLTSILPNTRTEQGLNTTETSLLAQEVDSSTPINPDAPKRSSVVVSALIAHSFLAAIEPLSTTEAPFVESKFPRKG